MSMAVPERDGKRAGAARAERIGTGPEQSLMKKNLQENPNRQAEKPLKRIRGQES